MRRWTAGVALVPTLETRAQTHVVSSRWGPTQVDYREFAAFAASSGDNAPLRKLHERLAPIALGTLAANLLGSFLLGLLAGGLAGRLPESLQRGLTVGLLGGFTTFSSFSVEAVQLGRLRGLPMTFLQLSLHLCLGLTAAAASRTSFPVPPVCAQLASAAPSPKVKVRRLTDMRPAS